jgi:Protein of unknown function DUF262
MPRASCLGVDAEEGSCGIMLDEAETQILEAVSEEDEIIPFEYSITSYGADYPVDGLVKRIRKGDIFVPTFQRAFVWGFSQASRFVESLLLGLPVPAIFLSKEPDTQKLLVIDGHQRLRTLQHFYEGVFAASGREFALRGVPSRFKGATYRSLAEEDRRRLDDSIIHAIIVKQDEPSEDESSIYHIFERLNTGGTLLLPQEIRACIYHGDFNALIGDLNKNEAWRHLFGPVSSRMRDQELILRFFALHYAGEPYKKPMKKFLNTYMAKNRYLKKQSGAELTRVFQETVSTIAKGLGEQAFKRKGALNAAVFDALMIGIARRLSKGPIRDLAALQKAVAGLHDKREFISAVERATSDEESVNRRIGLASEVFASAR